MPDDKWKVCGWCNRPIPPGAPTVQKVLWGTVCKECADWRMKQELQEGFKGQLEAMRHGENNG